MSVSCTLVNMLVHVLMPLTVIHVAVRKDGKALTVKKRSTTVLTRTVEMAIVIVYRTHPSAG